MAKPKTDIEKLAARAARRVSSAAVGFDPLSLITILTTLLPSLLQLFQSCRQSTPMTAKQFLAANYDGEDFSTRLYRQSRGRVRREARAAGQRGRLTNVECDEISHAAFMEGMRADDETVQSCSLAASAMPPFSE